jgi:DNA invertase Pin-like site-specific DNA recombinase
MGFEIVARFEDHASGSEDNRPALNRLMPAAHQRKFDAVLVGSWMLRAFA